MLLGMLSFFSMELLAQANCGSAQWVGNQNSGNCRDRDMSSAGVDTNPATAAITTPQRVHWFRFRSAVWHNSGQPMTITYTNKSSADNIAIEVYEDGGCPDPVLLGSADPGTTTASVTFNANANTRYRIRVMNMTADNFVNADLCFSYTSCTNPDGNQSLVSGGCTNTNVIDISDPGNSGLADPPCITAGSIQMDHWYEFTTSATLTAGSPITLNYNYTDARDVAVAVYASTGCPTAPIVCANAIGATTGTESVTFNANPSTTYHLRLMNLTDESRVDGQVCITESSCTAAQAVPFSPGDDGCTPVGAVVMNDVGVSATANPACIAGTIFRDQWFAFTPGISSATYAIDYAVNATGQDIAFAVYDGCGGAELACANAGTTNTVESLTFNATASTTYYIRVMNLTSNTEVAGTLCFNKTSCNAPDATAFTINVAATINNIDLDESGAHPADLGGTCFSGLAQRDQWYRVSTDAGWSEPNTIQLEYDYTTTSAEDVVLMIYDTSCNPIACVNNQGAVTGAGSETAVFIANAGTDYLIRVINRTSDTQVTGDINVTNLTASSTSVDLGDCNEAFNVSGTDPNPRFANFVATTSGQVTIQYTNTNEDARLRVLNSGGVEMQNVNNLSGTGTEETVISVTAGQTYRIEITNVDATPLDAMTGFLCLYNELQETGDICSRAIDVSIGTCDFPLDIPDQALNNEGRTNCGTGSTDVWLRFEATTNTRVGIEFTNDQEDAAFEVYSVPTATANHCGNLTPELACVNGIAEIGTELGEVNVTAGNTYYVRIMNSTNGNPITGNLCIYEIFYRDDCSDLTAAGAPVLTLGDCDVKYNVLSTYSTSAGIGNTCGTSGRRMSYMRYDHTGANAAIRVEYNATDETTRPALTVYEILTSSLATACTASVEVFCASTNGLSSQASSFTAQNGYTYIIIVKEISATEQVLRGSLCIYEDVLRAEDNYYTAGTANQYTIGDCGQFNVFAEFSADGGLLAGTPTTISCNSETSVNDAWAWFEATATGDIVVEYDNNNGDVDVANNIALMLYETSTAAPNTTTIGGSAGGTCAAATVITTNQTITDFNLSGTGTGPNDFYNDGLGVLGCTNIGTLTGGTDNGWASYTADFTGNLQVYYEGPTNSLLAVYDACAGTRVVCNAENTDPSNIVSVAVTTGTTYYIRVAFDSGTGQNGSLRVMAEPTQVACVDNVIEGIETINYTAVAGRTYYIRVANLEGNGKSVPGTLCLRDDILEEGDLCGVAQGLLVGDCDIDFDLTNFTEDPGGLDPVACGTSVTGQRDGWISFTATSSQTTMEFLSSSNAALAVYRGSCGNLFFVDCVNDLGATANNIEKIKINTVVGLTYYVRIMNIDADLPLTGGKLCLYNTAERDVCDDNDLVTKLVGDCNVAFDVPNTFTNTGSDLRDLTSGTFPFDENNGSTVQTVETICDANVAAAGGTPSLASARDAWIRFIGNGNEVTITYENREATSDPAIAVYTALQGTGPVNCGIGINGAGNPENQYGCADNTIGASQQTESVTFQTVGGQQYIIRIIDMTGSGMTGTLCFSDGANNYDDPCTARELEVGDCSVPLNVENNAGCAADPTGPSCNGCTGGDAWAQVTRPYHCDPGLYDDATTASDGSPDQRGATYEVQNVSGTFECTEASSTTILPWLVRRDGNDGIAGTADDYCECQDNAVPAGEPFYNEFTIQYDNRDGSFREATNVTLAVYTVSGLVCPAGTGTFTEEGCSNNVVEGVEEVNIAGLTTANGDGGETYYIRVVNNESTTAFGDLCVFWGDNIADVNCPPSNGYGALEGEFKQFEVPRPSSSPYPPTASQIPQAEIPNCVLPRGSNPRSRNDEPIRSHAWMYFDVPATADYDAVTVQFDNTGQGNNPPNAAMAVYQMPNHLDGTGGDCEEFTGGADNGMLLVDCISSVYVGTESVTISIEPGRRYFVRVMNIHNENRARTVVGRIRVFPFTPCNVGEELVVDGDFAMWPAITRVSNPPVTDPPNNATPDEFNPTQTGDEFDDAQGDDILYVPTVTTNDPWPNDLDQNENAVNTGIARFATDYGFLRDRSNGSLNTYSATYNQYTGRQGELNPEGLYLVKQSPWSVKNDWYCFGVGYSGYGGKQGGGRPVQSYCAVGGGGYQGEPCVAFDRDGDGSVDTQGVYSPSDGVTNGIDRPAPFPETSDANFMIVNGSYNPSRDLFPGKVWCQTVERAGGQVGYYVFTIWVQNMISYSRRLDVPQMRLTICDMEDPDSPNSFPAVGSAGVTGSRLPGITRVKNQITGDLIVPVEHDPLPPNNRLQAYMLDEPYGAAEYCNMPFEPVNRRLKVLGSSFLVEETPDQWQVIRCIYRAPRDVTEFNLCVENLSLTKNGNDFGIDQISFRECVDADADAFDQLLKGDPCELADGPQALGIPLSARLLEFDGKLSADDVFLNWLAMAEENTKAYEVQRSYNGTDFAPIGLVKAEGGSGANSYNFVDENIPEGLRKIYYRLNIIDNNGFSKIGPMIEVDVSAHETFDFKIVPNPTSQGKNVELWFNMPAGKAAIQVFDLKGNQLFQTMTDAKEGENKVLLDTQQFKAGVYVVRLIQNGKAVSKKLLVM